MEMREIKFRAYHPLNKEMIYPKASGNFGYGDYHSYDILRDFSPENIMQFIGLHDNNGVDIYEGDIIKAGEDFYYVVFNDFNATYRMKGKSFMPYFGDTIEMHEITVIGNIHQHPNLLTK